MSLKGESRTLFVKAGFLLFIGDCGTVLDRISLDIYNINCLI